MWLVRLFVPSKCQSPSGSKEHEDRNLNLTIRLTEFRGLWSYLIISYSNGYDIHEIDFVSITQSEFYVPTLNATPDEDYAPSSFITLGSVK